MNFAVLRETGPENEKSSVTSVPSAVCQLTSDIWYFYDTGPEGPWLEEIIRLTGRERTQSALVAAYNWGDFVHCDCTSRVRSLSGPFDLVACHSARSRPSLYDLAILFFFLLYRGNRTWTIQGRAQGAISFLVSQSKKAAQQATALALYNTTSPANKMAQIAHIILINE